MQEKIPDIEQAVLEETQRDDELRVLDTPEIALPDCEVHNFIFLRTAKIKEKIKKTEPGEHPTLFKRIDTFYCRHCLRYTSMERKEPSTVQPDWYRDDK